MHIHNKAKKRHLLIKEQRRKNPIKEEIEIEKIIFEINKTKESKHTDINKEKIK